jgi:hypothetical protein
MKAKQENWDDQIQELSKFFKTHKLPTKPVKLNDYETITNVFEFLKSHFAIVRANNGNPRYLPYLKRLIELKEK